MEATKFIPTPEQVADDVVSLARKAHRDDFVTEYVAGYMEAYPYATPEDRDSARRHAERAWWKVNPCE